jgi:hydrogenase maturation protein HypF
MIAKGINCPQTSSVGRLFDAVAAILELRTEVQYEGQAAVELEVLATTCTDRVTSYPFLLHPGHPVRLDVTPVIDAIVKDIVQGLPTASIAKRFHVTVTEMLAATCYDIRKQTGLNRVALSGGVFQNQLLLEGLMARLATMEFEVYINRRVPPNDGGLSLGQLAVAAARLRNMTQGHQ